MSYEILTISNSDELIVRNDNDRTQRLILNDLRDLMQLRDAIDAHLD